MKLFRSGRLTASQAAQLAGVSSYDFISIAKRREELSREDRAILYIAEETLKEDWESSEDDWWDEY